MAVPLAYNFRNLRVRAFSTVMTVLSVGLVVAVFIGVMALARGLEEALVTTGEPLNVVVLRQGSQVETSSAVRREALQVIQYLPGVATDAAGTPLTSPEVIVGRPVAERFQNAGLGGTLRFGRSQWKVVGVFEAGRTAFGSEVWTDAGELADDFDRADYSSVLLRAENTAALRAIVQRIEQREFRAAVERAEAALAAVRARLAELEAGSRPEEIERAEAAVEEARSNVANAVIELERFERLHADGAVARQALDAARNRHEVALAQQAIAEKTYQLSRLGPRQEQIDQARAQVREAEAALKAAQVDLDSTFIRAPIGGTILERLVEPGEIVTISFIGGRGAKSAVLSLANLQMLDVEVDVSQNEIGKVRLNQPASIVADAFPDRTYRGQVTEMAPEANRQKATLQVKVRIADPDGVIRPEMNAKVTFLEPPSGKGGPAKVFAPKEAIFTREGQSFVYVLNQGKATARAVKVGAEADGRVEVPEGLAGDESVVVRGVEVLQDGQRVRVKK